jgi:hypothetical protein
MVLFMVTYWSEADDQVMTGTHSFDKVTQNSIIYVATSGGFLDGGGGGGRHFLEMTRDNYNNGFLCCAFVLKFGDEFDDGLSLPGCRAKSS